MGAWYVLSALGLYQPAPGVTENFTLGAVPLFVRARLKALDIMVEAPSASEASPSVQAGRKRGGNSWKLKMDLVSLFQIILID